MSNAEILVYLDMLSKKISTMYDVSKPVSDEIVERSPMRELLQDSAEYVAHNPLRSWAELVYEAQMSQ